MFLNIIFFEAFKKIIDCKIYQDFEMSKYGLKKDWLQKKDSVIIFHPIFEWRRTIVQNKTTKNKIEKIARKPWKGT